MDPFVFHDSDRLPRSQQLAELARLRREAPVAWIPHPETSAGGYWLVTRHADIVHIARQPTLFSVERGVLLDDLPPSQRGALAMPSSHFGVYDPPRHTQLRQLINPHFTPRVLSRLEARIRDRARASLARAAAQQSCDLAEDVALALPVEVVLHELLGVPAEDCGKLSRASILMVAAEDPAVNPRRVWRASAIHDIHSYGLRIWNERRVHPREDLVSLLAQARMPDGGALTDELFLACWFPLIVAAFDTTASAIAGGVLALLEHPEQRDRLIGDPALVPTAVEEILRWVSPVIYFRRTATADTTVNDQAIAEGQKVLLCYLSGNRDDEVFSRPELFDVSRSPNHHIAFGHGVHFCLGARLAQLILQVFYEELLPWLPRMTLAGEPRRIRSFWMDRIRSLPVTFAPGP
jgi:cholest-4-en-3-one 26-monooxygenase